MSEDWEFPPGPTVEISRRQREVQLLLNIVEPDPEYQATFISDKATVFDLCGAPTERIRRRLEAYFCGPLPVDAELELPELIDSLKSHFPTWPDDWPPEPY